MTRSMNMNIPRDKIHGRLEAAIAQSGGTYESVAQMAGLTVRHLYRARKGLAPAAAVQVLRALGYVVREWVTIVKES